MRPVPLTAAAFMLSLFAFPATAPAQGQGPVDVSPNTTFTGQPPFGGSFESRLERLGADVDGAVKQRWISLDLARAYQGRIKEILEEVKAIRAMNDGKLPDLDNRRLQARVTAMHEEIGDIAVAARRGNEKATSSGSN